jgi:hypothetical protein
MSDRTASSGTAATASVARPIGSLPLDVPVGSSP